MSREAKVCIKLTDKLIRLLLCAKLKEARGHLFTVKAGRLCVEIYGSVDAVPTTCRVAVRGYVMTTLRDAVVYELTNKTRIVVDVKKAWDLLRCEEISDYNVSKLIAKKQCEAEP